MSVKRFLVRDDAGAANDEAAWVETVLASDYDALAAQLAESQRALSVCSKGFDAMCKRAVAAEARIRGGGVDPPHQRLQILNRGGDDCARGAGRGNAMKDPNAFMTGKGEPAWSLPMNRSELIARAEALEAALQLRCPQCDMRLLERTALETKDVKGGELTQCDGEDSYEV